MLFQTKRLSSSAAGFGIGPTWGILRPFLGKMLHNALNRGQDGLCKLLEIRLDNGMKESAALGRRLLLFRGSAEAISVSVGDVSQWLSALLFPGS